MKILREGIVKGFFHIDGQYMAENKYKLKEHMKWDYLSDIIALDLLYIEGECKTREEMHERNLFEE